MKYSKPLYYLNYLSYRAFRSSEPINIDFPAKPIQRARAAARIARLVSCAVRTAASAALAEPSLARPPLTKRPPIGTAERCPLDATNDLPRPPTLQAKKTPTPAATIVQPFSLAPKHAPLHRLHGRNSSKSGPANGVSCNKCSLFNFFLCLIILIDKDFFIPLSGPSALQAHPTTTALPTSQRPLILA